MTTKTNNHSPIFSTKIITMVAIMAIIGFSGIAYNVGLSNSPKPQDGFYVNGHITAWIGTPSNLHAKLVANKTDQLYIAAYSFAFCKLFNDSFDCSGAGTGCSGSCSPSASCPQLTGPTGTPTGGLSNGNSKNYCTISAIGLSTTNTVPGGSTLSPKCTSYINTNGLGAVGATATGNSAPTPPNTSPDTLSATFTDNTATTSGIQGVCLFMFNGYDKVPVIVGSPPNTDAIDSLGTSISLVVGASLTIQWQFSL